ncbi:MAG TPA: type II secretion system F family protein [Chloroflexota bacterium]|nr:type II secretion system F family protein [Chloroflexota bacterium]
MVPFLLSIFAGAGVALVFIGMNLADGKDAITMRLQQFTAAPPTLREVEMVAAPRERILKPLIARASRFLSGFQGKAALERLEKQLLMAGSPASLTVEDLLGWKGLGTLVLAVLGVVLALMTHSSLIKMVIFGVVGGVGGYMAPSLILKQKVKQRQKKIIRVLPDAIDMLSISVEAGLGFDAAMGRLSSKMRNELTMEFDRAAAEIRMGRRRRDALRNLIERTGVEDLSQFVNALIQADNLGVGVTGVLKAQAGAMRVKRRQRAEERARKAPVKMMFPLVCLLFPPLMIIILGPALPALLNGISVK